MDARSLRNEWSTGWPIVAGAAVGIGTGISLYLLVMSLFVVQITREFGWSRGQMGIGQMLAFLTGAAALPLTGRLVDRFGFRRVAAVCVPALALLYLTMSFEQGSFTVHLALMIWGGIFGGGTGAVVYTRPVIAAFSQQRGLALGLATTGISVTAMIVPPVLVSVMTEYGWRGGLRAMAVLTGCIGLPLALALTGHTRAAVEASHGGASLAERSLLRRRRALGTDATLGQARRDVRFWLLLAALVAINIPGSGVVGQLAPLVSDRGLPETSVALVMSIYAAGLLAGRLITGFFLDRMTATTVAVVMTFIPALGVALLLVSAASFALVASAVLLIGLQQGSEIDLLAYFISHHFGVTHFGAIYAAIGVAGALSTGAALVFFGRVHDVTGSYDLALIVGGIAFCVGAAAFGAVGSPLRPLEVQQTQPGGV